MSKQLLQRCQLLGMSALCLCGVSCSAVTQSARPIFSDRSPQQAPTATPRRAPAANVPVTRAKPAPGKPGFVLSPSTDPPKLIDVRNVPSGTRVRDPYSGEFVEVP